MQTVLEQVSRKDLRASEDAYRSYTSMLEKASSASELLRCIESVIVRSSQSKSISQDKHDGQKSMGI